MAHLAIAAEVRRESGKGAARSLRRQGKVPGIVYGRGKENLGVQVDALQLQKLLQSAGSSGLIDLKVDGEARVVLVKDVQVDPVMGQPLHVDFHAVSLDQEVLVTVPIHLVGEEARESDGGIVSLALREVAVYCLPASIPERIDVDVSKLAVGDSVTIGDVQFPEGVRPQIDAKETVVSVMLPAAEPEPQPEEAGPEADEQAEAGEGKASEEEASEATE